jgi:molybdenum cofactor cytidylyltransferase
MESGRHAVTEVPADGPIPLDVDTWEDYQLLLARDAGGLAMGASS